MKKLILAMAILIGLQTASFAQAGKPAKQSTGTVKQMPKHPTTQPATLPSKPAPTSGTTPVKDGTKPVKQTKAELKPMHATPSPIKDPKTNPAPSASKGIPNNTKATTKVGVVTKADGTPDKRFKQPEHLKKDGTRDMRYKKNK